MDRTTHNLTNMVVIGETPAVAHIIAPAFFGAIDQPRSREKPMCLQLCNKASYDEFWVPDVNGYVAKESKNTMSISRLQLLDWHYTIFINQGKAKKTKT